MSKAAGSSMVKTVDHFCGSLGNAPSGQRRERGSEEAVDGPDIDRRPGQHRHAMHRCQGLHDPRRDRIAATRGLERWLDDQHAPHGVVTSAVASASSAFFCTWGRNATAVMRPTSQGSKPATKSAEMAIETKKIGVKAQ